jgi:hypothetical protein
MAIMINRRSPHAIVLLVYGLGTGGLALARIAPLPAPVALWLGPVASVAWECLMATYGALGLYAMLIRRVRIVLSLRLESAAMLIGAGPLLLYAVIIFTAALPVGLAVRLFGGGLVGLFGVANLIRVWQLRNDLAGLPLTKR